MTLDEIKALVDEHHRSRRDGANRKTYPRPLRNLILDFIDSKQTTQYEVTDALGIAGTTLRRWTAQRYDQRQPHMVRLSKVVIAPTSKSDDLRARLAEERRQGLVVGNRGYSDELANEVGQWAIEEVRKGKTLKSVAESLSVSAGSITKWARWARMPETKAKPVKHQKVGPIDPTERRRSILWELLQGAKEREDVDSAIEILRMIGELPSAK